MYFKRFLFISIPSIRNADINRENGMPASVKNIFKLMGYAALLLTVSLVALVVAFQIMIGFRSGAIQTPKFNVPFQQMFSGPSHFDQYYGQYVLIKGKEALLFPRQLEIPTSLNYGEPLAHVNEGWIVEGHASAFETVYTKSAFNGRKLRYIEKWGFKPFLGRVMEDWEIDFSRFPEIRAKDHKRRAAFRYKYK